LAAAAWILNALFVDRACTAWPVIQQVAERLLGVLGAPYQLDGRKVANTAGTKIVASECGHMLSADSNVRFQLNAVPPAAMAEAQSETTAASFERSHVSTPIRYYGNLAVLKLGLLRVVLLPRLQHNVFFRSYSPGSSSAVAIFADKARHQACQAPFRPSIRLANDYIFKSAGFVGFRAGVDNCDGVKCP
jgi:hypothetical protein